MGKKSNIAIIISIVSVLISAFSLLLTYVNYTESRKIALKWEAYSENGIFVKPAQGSTDSEEGILIDKFYIPLWIKFQVTNTGSRTFSVDYVLLTANRIDKGPEMHKQLIISLGTIVPNPKNIRDVAVTNEMSFPLVVDPGHSKVFYKLIKLPISDRLYNAYCKSFKGKDFSIGDVYRLDNNDFHISSQWKIYAEIILAGGESKYTHVRIDERDAE